MIRAALLCLLALLTACAPRAGAATTFPPAQAGVALAVSTSLPPSLTPSAAELEPLMQAVYTAYRDEADFVFIVANNASHPSGVAHYGSYQPVRNDTRGLGMALFDSGARFGSRGPAARLQGVMIFPSRDAILYGPSLHELAHRWGNDLVVSGDDGHFGFSSAGRQLGGFDARTFRDLGGGTYQATSGLPGARTFGLVANGGNSVPYSDVELYAMGVIAPQDVAPFQVADGARWVDESRGTFTARSVRTVTAADLAAQHGPRQPDARRSQKTFTVLTVLVDRALPSAADVQAVQAAVAHLTQVGDDGDDRYFTFWEAARGLADLRALDAGALRR